MEGRGRTPSPRRSRSPCPLPPPPVRPPAARSAAWARGSAGWAPRSRPRAGTRSGRRGRTPPPAAPSPGGSVWPGSRSAERRRQSRRRAPRRSRPPAAHAPTRADRGPPSCARVAARSPNRRRRAPSCSCGESCSRPCRAQPERYGSRYTSSICQLPADCGTENSSATISVSPSGKKLLSPTG